MSLTQATMNDIASGKAGSDQRAKSLGPGDDPSPQSSRDSNSKGSGQDKGATSLADIRPHSAVSAQGGRELPLRVASPSPRLSLGLDSNGKDFGLIITSEGLSKASYDDAEEKLQTPLATSIKGNGASNQLAMADKRNDDFTLPVDEPRKKRPVSVESDLYGVSIREPSLKEVVQDTKVETTFKDKVLDDRTSDPFEDTASYSSSKEPAQEPTQEPIMKLNQESIQEPSQKPSQDPGQEYFIASLAKPFQWHLESLDNATSKPTVVPQTRDAAASTDQTSPPLPKRAPPPPPRRAAPPIPQLSLNVTPSDSDDGASRSDDNSLPTPSDGGASSDYGHRRSLSSNDGSSSLAWSEQNISHNSDAASREAATSPSSVASPISPREQAQMKLQGLQRQLAEAKARGDSKGAQLSLEKSIEIIHQTYLPKAPSRPPTTWPPIPKSSSRNSLLRLPSLAQLANRAKKPQIQALFNAVRSDDVPTIKDYLGQGVSVNARSEDFETPLMHAAMHGKLRSMEILKQCGADEFAVNAKGQTVLHLAITTRQMYAVQWLLEAYPYDESTSAQPKSWRLSRSPSSLGTRSPKSLREASDKEGFRPLHVAASQNLPDLLLVLVTGGAIVEARNNWGGTPLHAAIFTNSLQAASALLSESAKVDVVDINGMSPLHWAAKLGYIGAIDLLLKAGAGTSFSGSGDRPIHAAIRQGHLAVVEHFMFHGSDVETKTQKGDTLLLVAVQANQVKIAEFLLKHSSNANPFSRLMPVRVNSDGTIATRESSDRSQPPLTTPLHFACFAGWYEMSALLLDHQALVNVTNSDGKSPIILATEADDTNLVYLLIARGAKVNATIPGSMQNAAHIAALKGNLETLQKLYQSGANIHARASDMRSPEEFALKCGNAAKSQAIRTWFAEIRSMRIMKARQQRQQSQQSQHSPPLTTIGEQNYVLNSPPVRNDLALIQQLSPPNQHFDPQYDSFPEAPPPYVAGPSAPTRLANRPGVYRPPGSS